VQETHLEIQVDDLVQRALDLAAQDGPADLHAAANAVDVAERGACARRGRRRDGVGCRRRREAGLAGKVLGGREVALGEEVVGDEEVQVTASGEGRVSASLWAGQGLLVVVVVVKPSTAWQGCAVCGSGMKYSCVLVDPLLP